MTSPFAPPPPGVARVWLIDAKAPAAPTSQLEATLSDEDLSRANRFVFAADRTRFVVARGSLRAVLGHTLSTPPADLRFSYGPFGKPTLETRAEVSFNVSHSDDLIAIAVAPGDSGLDLGIDVERVRDFPDMRGVASSVFTNAELAALDEAADAEARREMFFRLWTRKEACMKATGAGFSLPPNSFEVDGKATFQRVAVPSGATGSLSLIVHDLPKLDGYGGALAIGSDRFTIEVLTAARASIASLSELP